MTDTIEVTDEQYVEKARSLYQDEGTLEVDDGATVSRGDDDGAYVQAWVWVSNVEFEECDGEFGCPCTAHTEARMEGK